MKLTLNRFIIGKQSTIGALAVNGEFYCWTLEDRARAKGAPKVYGATAIPTGKYPVIVNMSPRLKKRYPRLVGVPGFDGILIHAGNDAGDTTGCILVGLAVDSPDRISRSTEAFRGKDGKSGLFKLIDDAYSRGELVTIEVTNQWDEEPFGSLDEYEWRA